MVTDILVTGAAGNIGSALCRSLCARQDYRVVAIDDLSTGHRDKLPVDSEHLRFVKADANDFADLSGVFSSCRPRFVFHFAAVVGVQRTLANPLKVLRDIDGFRNILSLSKNCGVERVFYSSSSEVYGEPVSLPQHEIRTPLNSRLPYAVVKNVGEAFCRSYQAEHGLQFTIFRFFNTYGPSQSEDFVVPRLMRRALRGEDLTIYGDGTQTRTFCYIDDNIDTLTTCMDLSLCINEVLNVGSDVEITVLDLARLIISVTGSKSRIIHHPALPEGDMTRRCPDVSKMKGILGRPLVEIEEGLGRLLSNWRAARR